ncbi:hypothetical protein [Thermomonas flagellata]|uniref:hypothetical protein n=1 Tax=Thermomonas flagellata TaxID=2888524 RepID=UPI001F04722C|nr:hypothetical protein [Thermomonas flagellata]
MRRVSFFRAATPIAFVLAAWLGLSPGAIHAQSAADAGTCSVRQQGQVLRIVPHDMSDVREISILRPDGGRMYLYRPEDGAQFLPPMVRGGFEFDAQQQLALQRADDGKFHPRKVFGEAGRYVFQVIGKTTKTIPGIVYSRNVCEVDFAPETGITGAQETHAAISTARPALPAGGCAGHPHLQAVCNATQGCSSERCCSRDTPGSTCYCSTCCVAVAATGTATSRH